MSDIVDRLKACETRSLVTMSEETGQLVRSSESWVKLWQCLQDAADEIKRLRDAIRRLADQDATLSVQGGSVTVTMDATLTDEEREALQFMLRHAAWACDREAFHDSGDYRTHHDEVFRLMGRNDKDQERRDMNDDNKQGAAEPSSASAGSHGDLLPVLRTLADGVRGMGIGEPDSGDRVEASDIVRWAVDEIEQQRGSLQWLHGLLAEAEERLARLRLTDEEREAIALAKSRLGTSAGDWQADDVLAALLERLK